MIAEQVPQKLREGGALADISPTLLAILGISLPAEMTGHDLRDTDYKEPAAARTGR
jgi:bisphosphoglycerate-independent phosphoglycerate mutase (AlkP superfamily)